LAARTDLRLVLFVPPAKVALIRGLYGAKNVIVEGLDLDPLIRSSSQKFWYRLAFLIENTQYVRDQRRERLFRHRTLLGRLNHVAVDLSARVLSRLPFVMRLYRWLDWTFGPKDAYARFFDTYTPDLVFITDLFSETDVLLYRTARSRGTRAIGMVRSWDNTTTKGIVRFVPERIIVNSDVLRGELERLHGVDPHIVSVVGSPQFDAWVGGPTMSREKFFGAIGADPAKRLVMFAPAGSNLSSTDWQLCEILRRALDDGRLPTDLQFLVRNHPQHPADLSQFAGDKRFIVEVPGTRVNPTDYKSTEISPADDEHLRNSVYYSEVVMYIATSLGLDATVFDKPQIIVSFDGWERKPHEVSINRFNSEDCLATMVSQGGTRVARSEKEWIDALSAYLADPSLDAAGRAKARDRHLYRVDGKAGERIARIVSDALHS
jgi:hypothetical protein